MNIYEYSQPTEDYSYFPVTKQNAVIAVVI